MVPSRPLGLSTVDYLSKLNGCVADKRDKRKFDKFVSGSSDAVSLVTERVIRRRRKVSPQAVMTRDQLEDKYTRLRQKAALSPSEETAPFSPSLRKKVLSANKNLGGGATAVGLSRSPSWTGAGAGKGGASAPRSPQFTAAAVAVAAVPPMSPPGRFSKSPPSFTSPAFGPSPLQPKTSREKCPSTEGREAARQRARAKAAASYSVKRGLDLLSSSLGCDSVPALDQIRESAAIARLVNDKLLDKMMGSVKKQWQNKCFSFCRLVVWEHGESKVTEVASVTLPYLFWSSGKNMECKDGRKLIGVDVELVVSATKTSAQSFPLCDHHSERAVIMYISRNLMSYLPKLKYTSEHTVGVLIGTKFSSCSHCARTLGRGDKQGRVAHALQEIIKKAMPSVKTPHVIIGHQGMEHYHRDTRDENSTPTIELYPTQSLVKKDFGF
ncbi:MAG: hypothetical protein P0S95_04735 [Rhabdochlamydiaceae bacterium]|nr:hypothetical protein [Candidatus Amphrikana amoebophyrae]